MKKVTLIGLGRWGKNILRELVALGSEVKVLFHNPSPEKEHWLKENYPNVFFTYDMGEVTGDASIENVVIATPMDTHLAVAEPFIAHKKRIFLEKPIALNLPDSRKLVSLVEGQGQDFMVGHIFLYHVCFEKLREILEGKSVTKMHSIKTLRREGDINDSKPLFLDSFIHEISVLIKLFGKPSNASYDKQAYVLTLTFGDMEANISVVKPEKEEKIRKMEFYTTGGVYTWSNDELVGPDGGKICEPNTPTLRRELDIFLNHYDMRRADIESNNRVALQCVEILESLWLKAS